MSAPAETEVLEEVYSGEELDSEQLAEEVEKLKEEVTGHGICSILPHFS